MAQEIPLIAHVIFRLDTGGLENGLVNLINQPSADRYRHAIICIDDFSDFKDRIKRSNVEIYAIRKKPGTDFGALWRLYRVFRQIKPTILHSRNIAGLDALLPAFLAGIRHRIHGEHGWDIHDLDGNNKKMRILRKIHKPLVSQYIALSKQLFNYLANAIAIPSSRIAQIYNGVDTERFHPAARKDTVRKNLAVRYPLDAIVVGTVGRLQPVKGQVFLVEAFAQLLQRVPALRSQAILSIVGDGTSMDEIVRAIEHHRLTDNCWVPGHRTDVSRILQTFDIFVLPSLAEGISNTILESMACGVPVIATNVGGNAELVKTGVNGTIVPAGDAESLSRAIEDYIVNQQLRIEHGNAGRQNVVANFSLEKMVDAYMAVYDQCTR